MMRLLSFIIFCFAQPASAEPPKVVPAGERPALIETSAIVDFETLPEDRKRLIETAIAVAKDSPYLPYRFGGSDPKDGGFDCSGAIHYVLTKAGLTPPRTSAEQYLWLKGEDRLVETPLKPADMTDPTLQKLRPGDLLFWGGTYTPSDDRKINVTHVAIYLGKEKSDGLAVMINATDGRSYRGKKANGYGVYDFRLPSATSKSVFMGYGTPPGIAP